MTTPDAESAVNKLRPLFAWGLLAYVAVALFFTLLAWLVPTGGSDIIGRSWNANGTVTGLVLIALPLVAVLITSHVRPASALAKLIAFVALAEYAFIVLFGLLTFLIGLLYMGELIHDATGAFNTFSAILQSVIRLGLAALAALLVFRTFTGLGGKLTMPGQQQPPATPTY